MIPRFTLTSAAIPTLKKGEETAVYEALIPYGQTHSLEELVERCCALGFMRRKNNPPALSYIWESVLWHLRNLKHAGVVKDE